MILSSKSLFLALILPLLYRHYLKPLIPSTLGSLLIDSLLILTKTEYLLIGTQQQRSKVTDSTLSFHSTTRVPVSSARNLGVVFQSDLSFNQHISNVCRAFFYHIRQLRQIRPSLDLNSSIQLANALVSSKLDYCNSLLYGLPDTSIQRLQRVQNSLARVIYPSLKRSDHISPTLAKLHWLPIHKRIKFKVATITFKVLQHKQPSYLFDLLKPHNPQRKFDPLFYKNSILF